MPRTFAVVGASVAGASAAAALREEGFDGRLVLVGAEPHLPYDRPPLSKGYLAGTFPREKLALRPAGFWEQQDVELRLGTRATALDPARRELTLDDGEQLRWDALLLATGGRNRTLPVPGAELEGVHSLRTVDDADRLAEAASRASSAVVVGMGFIGSEIAATLRGRGLAVTAIEPFSTPLERVLGAEVGAALAALHEEHGVECLFGEGVEAFEGTGRVEAVRTSSGRAVPCELAVVGVGIVPVTELAETAGLAVDDGILVDACLRASAEGVYAAGDAARHAHPLLGEPVRVEHWTNAVEQGRAAARAMLGRPEPYDAVHWFWSDQYDANLQYAGHHRTWDELVVRGSLEERRFVAFYLEGGVVRAAVALNMGRDLRRSIPLIRSRARAEPAKLRDPEVDLRTLAPAAER
jgi:3-phenylpropionate/trans-cinnamate dioxygenase ferredoxin reductase subunit